MGLLLGVATMNPKTAQTIASVVLMIMVRARLQLGAPAWSRRQLVCTCRHPALVGAPGQRCQQADGSFPPLDTADAHRRLLRDQHPHLVSQWGACLRQARPRKPSQQHAVQLGAAWCPTIAGRVLPAAPPPCRIGWLKYTSFIFYTLQILLFIEFDGGGRPVYSCTNPASGDVCAQVSPDQPETNPSCSAVGE